jgi:tRNA (guanine-N7-)-methyltransferase
MTLDNLKKPFEKKQRSVFIKDRIWYVPEDCVQSEDFIFSGWNSKDFFGNDHPVRVEYCSGNGAWIADKAMTHPHINWIAVEKRFVRVNKIESKIKKMNMKNLITVCGEAYNATKVYFPEDSVSEIFINFPDPWPKRRHARNRLIQPLFLDEMRRILKDDGTITIVTDDPDYSRLMINEFAKHQGFDSCYPDPYYETERLNYGTSFFEELWRQKGKVIRYHTFRKRLLSL